MRKKYWPVRTSISLSHQQHEFLKSKSEEKKVSICSIAREAIDHYAEHCKIQNITKNSNMFM